MSCCSIDGVCMSVALSSSLLKLLALPVGRPDVDQVTERRHVGLMGRKLCR